MGYIQGADRNQVILLPDTLDDYVGEDNEVRAIDASINCVQPEKASLPIDFTPSSIVTCRNNAPQKAYSHQDLDNRLRIL